MRAVPMLGELVGGDSAAFHAFNRNKRSITVDLKNPEGRAALLKMAESFDVVVENFRTGVMERLGLGYAAFKAVNPRIIYASGSGWGAESAEAQAGLPGQDLLVQAMSGVMDNTGRAGDPPTACGTPIADFAASQALAIGILGALLARQNSGRGQQVETSLYAATLGLMAQENFAVLNQDMSLTRSESGLASAWNDAPYGPHPCCDGWVVIALCPLATLARLFDDDELGKMDPWAQRDETKRRIDSHTRQYTKATLLDLLRTEDVWAAPVRSSQETMRDLLNSKSPRLLEMNHPKAGKIRAIANPVSLSETPVTLRRVPPQLGADTADVIGGILGAEALEKLRAAGALG